MLATLRLKEKEGTFKEDNWDSVATIISNMTTVGNKLVLEVLAKAFYNYKMAEVADILTKLYEASDEAVIRTMSHILENENSDQLLYVFQVLLACPDKISRFNTARIVATLVNRCFEIEKGFMHESETVKIWLDDEELIQTGATSGDDSREPKYGEITRPRSMALRFWDLAMIALKEKAPSCWSKFDHFLTMIRDIVNGGETQIEVIMSRNGLIELVDFILGPNSPLCKPGERRTKMGSIYGSPNFVPLLEAISTLVLRCYTPNFTKEIAHDLGAKGQRHQYYFDLSEDEIQKFFLNEEFIKIAIINSSEALGEWLAHLWYRNLWVSKEIGKVMLKIINTSDFEKIKLWMTVTKPYLYIDDEYKRNRAEWILGFSCLSIAPGPQHMLPRFGTASINQITDEPYTYLSPIDLKRNNEALLALLWRYRGKMDIYVVNWLNILLEIIVGNKFLSEYMFNSDPPTYEFARFTDWFRPYLDKELEKAKRNMAYRQSPKKEEWIVKCLSFMDLYDANLSEYEKSHQGPTTTQATETCSSSWGQDWTCSAKSAQKASGHKDIEDQQNINVYRDIIEQDDDQMNLMQEDQPISCYPKRYIIGCTVKLEEIAQEERDGIIVTTHKVYTEYAESQPTLAGNKTLPGYAFHNSKLDADNFDLRYYNQSNSKDAEFYCSEPYDLTRGADQPAVNVMDDREAIIGQSSETSQTDETNDREPENTQDSTAAGAEEQCTASEWNLPKSVGDVVILVTVNNTTSQTYNLKMAFCWDDDFSRGNIKAPVNDIETLVKPYFNDMWMCVHKVFPEKDWGQFHIEWSFEEKQKQEMPKNMVFGYSGRDVGDDVDDYNHIIYGPNIQMNYYSFI